MSHKETKVLLLGLLVAAIIVMLIICMDGHSPVVVVERLDNNDEVKYPNCPSGYILSGANCVPDGSKHKLTCDNDIDTVVDGMCRKMAVVSCPNDFVIKSKFCYNPKTKEQIPFDQATCPPGYDKNGPFCYKEYEGKCPTNYKNMKMGDMPCVQEFDTMSPSCPNNYNLKNGKCYKSATAVEAFARANAVEQKALSSLYNY
jgi:hypothetical protein